MWRTPKTNWIANDYINVVDYVRIKENIEYIASLVEYIPDIETVDVTTIPTEDTFQKIEQAINDLCDIILHKKLYFNLQYYGTSDLYYFRWDYKELNLIESVLFLLYNSYFFPHKLSFTLGGFKI